MSNVVIDPSQFTQYIGSASQLGTALVLSSAPAQAGAFVANWDFNPNSMTSFEFNLPRYAACNFVFSMESTAQTLAFSFPSSNTMRYEQPPGTLLSNVTLGTPLTSNAWTQMRLVSQNSNLAVVVGSNAFVLPIPNWDNSNVRAWPNGSYRWSGCNLGLTGTHQVQNIVAQSVTAFSDPVLFNNSVTASNLNSDRIGTSFLRAQTAQMSNLTTSQATCSAVIASNATCSNVVASNVTVAGTARVTDGLCVKDGVTSNVGAFRTVMALTDSTLPNANYVGMTFGKAASLRNEAQMFYHHLSDGNTANNMTIGTNGNIAMIVTAGGNVAIGSTATPGQRLVVTGNTVVSGSVSCSAISATNLGNAAFCNMIPYSMVTGVPAGCNFGNASATTDGFLLSNDWNRFNAGSNWANIVNKPTALSQLANDLPMAGSNTSGLLSAADWTRFNAGSNWNNIVSRPTELSQFTNDLTVLSTSTTHISFSTGNPVTERMRITTAGDVGIGTTSPTQRLHVVGGGRVTGDLLVGSATGGTTATVQLNSSGVANTTSAIQFVNNGHHIVCTDVAPYMGKTAPGGGHRIYYQSGGHQITGPVHVDTSLRVGATAASTRVDAIKIVRIEMPVWDYEEYSTFPGITHNLNSSSYSVFVSFVDLTSPIVPDHYIAKVVVQTPTQCTISVWRADRLDNSQKRTRKCDMHLMFVAHDFVALT